MIWFVIDGILGTVLLRFDSILRRIGKHEPPILYQLCLYSVSIIFCLVLFDLIISNVLIIAKRLGSI